MRECFCFGCEAVNVSGEAVRGLVKSRVEFPPAQIHRVFWIMRSPSAHEFRIGWEHWNVNQMLIDTPHLSQGINVCVYVQICQMENAEWSIKKTLDLLNICFQHLWAAAHRCWKKHDLLDIFALVGQNMRSTKTCVATQWIERLPSVQEVMGSIPVADSDFSLSHARVILISSLFTSDYVNMNILFQVLCLHLILTF